MTTYQKETVSEKTMEEQQAAQTNYFGTTRFDDDSLEQALLEFFQKS